MPKFFKWWLEHEFWVFDDGVLIRNPEIRGISFSERILSLFLKNTSMENYFTSRDEPAVLRAITALSLTEQSTILFGKAVDKDAILAQLNSVYPDLSNDPLIPEEYRADIPNKLTTNRQDELGPTISWCLHLEILKPWLEGRYFIDVAPILESALPQIAEKLGHTMVRVEDFLDATGKVLPFLDYGVYNSVTRGLNSSSPLNNHGTVSEVLSAAIYRLRAKKKLRISLSPDDPNTTEFISTNGGTERASSLEIVI
ncbi:hypothetical protein [Marinobacterium zhoushanense]|nr:hypothetical protein [Marinobacterium zhoushanense]